MLTLEAFESRLESLLDSLQCPEPLLSALKYSVFPAGKRLRPLLCMTFGEDLNLGESLFHPAAAIELIHASSLVHDDMPALDDDMYRRGRLSCHAKFGQATALLAGDYLIPLAFRLVATGPLMSEHVRLVTERLSVAFEQICIGQQLDVLPRTEDVLLSIYRRKTGALFGATLAIPAICAGRSERFIQNSWGLGEEFGILFQLIDDYLDLYGSDEARGRRDSSDERNGRITFFSDEVTRGEAAVLEASARVRGCLMSIHDEGVVPRNLKELLLLPVSRLDSVNKDLAVRITMNLRGEVNQEES